MARTEIRRARHRDLTAIDEAFRPRGAGDSGERAGLDFEELFGPTGWDDEDVVLVAVLDDRLVGVVGLVSDWYEAADVFWLAWLRVLDEGPGARCREKLLARALREARRRGGRKVFIDASARALREDARRMYEDLGFTVEARFRDYHRVGDDQIVYGLRLT